MSKTERWIIVIIVVVMLAFGCLATLYRDPQVRQTLCSLRCEHIEDDAAWEVCIGECLVEIPND